MTLRRYCGGGRGSGGDADEIPPALIATVCRCNSCAISVPGAYMTCHGAGWCDVCKGTSAGGTVHAVVAVPSLNSLAARTDHAAGSASTSTSSSEWRIIDSLCPTSEYLIQLSLKRDATALINGSVSFDARGTATDLYAVHVDRSRWDKLLAADLLHSCSGTLSEGGVVSRDALGFLNEELM